MLNNLSSLSRNKSSVFLLVLALIVGGVGAQATGLLNTRSGGYLVCVNSTTKVVTHPGTSSCPKGSKKLVLGAQGVAGASGLTGATGLSGRDGRNGTDGKTLWNGTADPVSTWGAPGDMFINSVTKTLFGPKDLTTGWPAGVIMVGATGAQGPIGLTGAQGPGGANGGSGPAGATGATGPSGSNGTNATIAINELFECDGPDDGTVANEKCKIGMTGPGGGLIFFVDYNDQYVGFNYLEAAPQGWGNGITVNQGGLTLEATGSTTVDPLMKWCSNMSTLLGLDAWSYSGVGKGATNTSTADTTCTGGAIQAAADYAGGSQTDWFLPSIGEAMLMYTNLRQAGVGGFVIPSSVTLNYSSSSELIANHAWYLNFGNGAQFTGNKNENRSVRPVRAF